MEEKEKLAEEVKAAPEAVEEPQTPAAEAVTEVSEEAPAQEETPKAEVAEEPAAQVETPAEKAEEAIEEVIEEAPSSVKKEIKKTVEKPAGPDEDFDWDAYERGDTLSKKTYEELEKVYDETLSAIKDHEVVEGTVIAINKREVVINVGFKSDGIVPASEFRYNPDLQVGDKVEVYIESQEDKRGQLLLSHKQARASRSWERVNAALESQEVVKGFVKCRTKGGMIVDVFIEAFLPGSQLT